MDQIVAFLSTRELPSDKAEGRQIKYKVAKYHLMNDLFYRRGYTISYLRCIHPFQVSNLLYKFHNGTCGNHIKGRALSRKALLQGYFWPTMAQDSIDYVRKCDKCKKFTNMSNIPIEDQVPTLSTWPFDQLEIDIVGLLPTGKGQVQFAMIAMISLSGPRPSHWQQLQRRRWITL